jgi:multisubunit Na+/H+ antiporter MnhG subunit
MFKMSKGIKDGMLITLLGIFGVIRVLDSFSDAGEMITRMLYTLLIIFIAIILIGIKTIKDELE